MAEKHHPASSRRARQRTERGQRREQKRTPVVPAETKQRKAFNEPTGFFRGARVRR